jgi:hypothetical protein
MKFKVNTIPHQYRSNYYGKGNNSGRSKYEYENIFDFKTPYIDVSDLKVNINLEDYDSNTNDVIVIPELCFRFENDINLYMNVDKEFYPFYEDSYIDDNGELILVRDNGTTDN